jgi:hypothetical protein
MAKIAKAQNRFLSGNNPRLKINLKEIFGDNLPDSFRFRQAIGQAIIDKIKSRAQNNLSRTGSRFPNYSKEYSESMEFIAAGKSRDNPNLTLSGDMLGLLDITSEGEGFIEIGWNDFLEAEKAHGHITGAVGRTRDFLGLPNKEIEEIRKQFIDLIEESNEDDESPRVVSFTEILNNLRSMEEDD